jgi:hypothetical protein
MAQNKYKIRLYFFKEVDAGSNSWSHQEVIRTLDKLNENVHSNESTESLFLVSQFDMLVSRIAALDENDPRWSDVCHRVLNLIALHDGDSKTDRWDDYGVGNRDYVSDLLQELKSKIYYTNNATSAQNSDKIKSISNLKQSPSPSTQNSNPVVVDPKQLQAFYQQGALSTSSSPDVTTANIRPDYDRYVGKNSSQLNPQLEGARRLQESKQEDIQRQVLGEVIMQEQQQRQQDQIADTKIRDQRVQSSLESTNIREKPYYRAGMEKIPQNEGISLDVQYYSLDIQEIYNLSDPQLVQVARDLNTYIVNRDIQIRLAKRSNAKANYLTLDEYFVPGMPTVPLQEAYVQVKKLRSDQAVQENQSEEKNLIQSREENLKRQQNNTTIPAKNIGNLGNDFTS